MDQSAFSAADIFSHSQKIPLILVNLNDHYCNHKSQLTTCARCTLRYRGLVSSDAAGWRRSWAAQGRPVEPTLVRTKMCCSQHGDYSWKWKCFRPHLNPLGTATTQLNLGFLISWVMNGQPSVTSDTICLERRSVCHQNMRIS